MPRILFNEFGAHAPERVLALSVDRKVARLGRDLAGNLLSVFSSMAHRQECLSLTMEALCSAQADLHRQLNWALAPREPLDAPETIGTAVFATGIDGRAHNRRQLIHFANRIEAGIGTLQSLAWAVAAQPRLIGATGTSPRAWLPADDVATIEARRKLCLAPRSRRVILQKLADPPQELDLPVIDEPSPTPEDDIVVDGMIDGLKQSAMVFEIRGKTTDTDVTAEAAQMRSVFGGNVADKKTFRRLAELLCAQQRARFRLRPLRAARPQAQYVYGLRSIFAVADEPSRKKTLIDG